MNASLNDRI